MKKLFGNPVFSLDTVVFRWEDVITAAEAGPRWAAFVRRTRQGLACMHHLEESDEEEPEQAVTEAAAEFRYERNLVSGRDAAEWMSRRGLTVAEWMEYIRRSVLRDLWTARASELVERYPVSADELEDALRVDAICSDEGLRLATDLAERAAAAAAAGEALEAGTISERLALVEQGFQRFRAGRITPEAVRRVIADRHLEWIRVDCRVMRFEDSSQASEAALCIRHDGLDFDDVALSAHAPVYEARFYLDELEPSYRNAFVGAQPSHLLGPIEFEGKHTLFRLLDKVMPSEKDPELVRRAREQLLEQALKREAATRVSWELGW